MQGRAARGAGASTHLQVARSIWPWSQHRGRQEKLRRRQPTVCWDQRGRTTHTRCSCSHSSTVTRNEAERARPGLWGELWDEERKRSGCPRTEEEGLGCGWEGRGGGIQRKEVGGRKRWASEDVGQKEGTLSPFGSVSCNSQTSSSHLHFPAVS